MKHIIDRETRKDALCRVRQADPELHAFYDADDVTCDACRVHWYRSHRDSLLDLLGKTERGAERFSLRLSDDPAAARALEAYMSDISEECYCAGWLHGLEEALWGFVQNGPGQWGQGDVTAENIAELKRLSDAAGGWWEWVEDVGCLFVSMRMWEGRAEP